MQNLENLDVFEILITQKLLKCPKDPFVRSALIYNFTFSPVMFFDTVRIIKKGLIIFGEFIQLQNNLY